MATQAGWGVVMNKNSCGIHKLCSTGKGWVSFLLHVMVICYMGHSVRMRERQHLWEGVGMVDSVERSSVIRKYVVPWKNGIEKNPCMYVPEGVCTLNWWGQS